MRDKVALVTGAGRGIGKAIALGLATAGAKVAIAARSQSQLDELATVIRGSGGHVLPLAVDLTDRSAPGRLDEHVRRHWGPIEILVNNAGIGSSQSPKAIVDFEDDFWDLTFLVNVTAPYLLTKLVLPSMIERRWGRIINIASINAKKPSLHGAAYTASKHAIVGLTKATALEAGEFGITANAICPGVTRSLMNDKRLEYDSRRTGKSFAQLEAESTPLGRRLEPDEMASLAVFLAGDGACAINGQAINVCGGAVMA